MIKIKGISKRKLTAWEKENSSALIYTVIIKQTKPNEKEGGNDETIPAARQAKRNQRQLQ
jgi:hypothetical protein